MHSLSQLAAMFRLPSWPCYFGLACCIGVFKKKHQPQPAGSHILGTKSTLFIRKMVAIWPRARIADQTPSPHDKRDDVDHAHPASVPHITRDSLDARANPTAATLPVPILPGLTPTR